ncbi:MAG: phosphatase PAP2 family protein [Acidimicrobiia bacterium]
MTTAAFVKLWDSARENGSTTRVDRDLTQWIVEHRTAAIVDVMQAVTRLGDGWVVAAVVAVGALVLHRERRRGATILVVSSAGSAVIVALTKQLVARPRPPTADAAIAANGYAFPSGHAAQSIACYGALAVITFGLTHRRRTRLLAGLGASTVALSLGVSRIVLGVHWLSDVLAGWTVATGWLSLVLLGTRVRRLNPSGGEKSVTS